MTAAPTPLEAAIVRRICKFLNTVPGLWYIKPDPRSAGIGTPDIIGCYCGRMFALEVKRPGRHHPVSPMQKRQLQAIANAGGLVAVVESLEDAQAVLEVPVASS